MRGRVMALYMAIFMGGTPIGAPFVGWVANTAGPRWSMAVAAGAGLLAALIGLLWIIRAKHLRLHFNRRARGLRVLPRRGTRHRRRRAWTAQPAPRQRHLAGTTPSDAAGYFLSSATTKSMHSSSAETSSGSIATNVAMRSWLPAQFAVRLGVDDAVGAETLAMAAASIDSSKSIVAITLERSSALATNGVA